MYDVPIHTRKTQLWACRCGVLRGKYRRNPSILYSRVTTLINFVPLNRHSAENFFSPQYHYLVSLDLSLLRPFLVSDSYTADCGIIEAIGSCGVFIQRPSNSRCVVHVRNVERARLPWHGRLPCLGLSRVPPMEQPQLLSQTQTSRHW